MLAVLVLALLATVALTAQAWLASRAQRTAAEAAVRDYARFAATNYAMVTQRSLRQSALAIFSWLGGKSSRLEADSLFDLRVLRGAFYIVTFPDSSGECPASHHTRSRHE